MIVRVTPTQRTLFLGISNRVLANMTPADLQLEAERVETQLARHHRCVRELGRQFGMISQVKAERRCLVSERQRIARELKRRREAAPEQAMDAADYAEAVQP